MPVSTSAKKALRRDRRRTITNYQLRAQLKNVIAQTKTKPSPENLKIAYSTIDKAAKKNLIHSNKAARLKSQLAKLPPISAAPLKKAPASKTKTKAKAKTKTKTKAKA